MPKNLRNVIVAAVVGGAIGARIAVDRGSIPGIPIDPAIRAHPQFLIASIVAWCAFSLYWEAAAKNAAPAQSSESPLSRTFHVALVNVAAMLVFIPFQSLGRFLPASPLVMIAGLAIQAGGTALAVWSRRHLGVHWSGAIQIKADPHLVRSGPYRRLRHPIYTGLLAMYIGPAMVTGERLALIGVALAIAAYLRKIRLEERALATAFGPAYDDYRREAWALIPGVY